jgi:hypothetical protein
VPQCRHKKSRVCAEEEDHPPRKVLTRMETLIPWTSLLAVIEPFYPKGERGRPPVGLERMLRIYFLQQSVL